MFLLVSCPLGVQSVSHVLEVDISIQGYCTRLVIDSGLIDSVVIGIVLHLLGIVIHCYIVIWQSRE